jgi:hypothetical protein
MPGQDAHFELDWSFQGKVKYHESIHPRGVSPVGHVQLAEEQGLEYGSWLVVIVTY